MNNSNADEMGEDFQHSPTFDLHFLISQLNPTSSLDLSAKYTLLSDLRDILDYVISSNYDQFLAQFIPASVALLQGIDLSVIDTAPEQKLRALLLDIWVKLPLTESYKNYSLEMANIMLNIFEHDNEDNALVALRFFIELHKAYRQILEVSIAGFIEVSYRMLSLLPIALKDHFESSVSTMSSSPSNFATGSTPPISDSASSLNLSRPLLKSSTSFKFLSELPVFLIMYFQIHKKIANDGITKFIPLIFQTLGLQVKAQADEIAINPHFIGVSPSIKNRSLYVEFIMLQVKALSFLAYVARVFPILVRPHQSLIPPSVLQLYRNCPTESVFIRKELLVSTRHLFTNDFQKLFVPFIEIFLNEHFALGTGVACNQMIRTLLYSMLADLIHHVRADLSPNVIIKVVSVFSKNIHDSSLPINLHSMSAKLILNIIDCLISDKFPHEMKPVIFSRIFGTFISKLMNLQWDIKNADSSNQLSNTLSDDTVTSTDIKKDMKFLLKTLISGMKSVILGFRNCYGTPLNHPSTIFGVRGFSLEDRNLFHEYFRSCIMCFSLFAISWDQSTHLADCTNDELAGLTHPIPLNVMTQDDKEVIDLFSHTLTIVDVAIFFDVLTANLPFLIEKSKSNLALLAIPQYFLAIANVSKHFCNILLKYLMEKLPDLGNMPFDESQIILRLFKLIFLSVTVFPEDNEQIILPYITEIILQSLRHSFTTKQPINYFILLKSLFRSIGGGRYEMLYKEVLPLLPLLLESLNSLISSTNCKALIELFVELCLTTPVRLSSLLPHLNLLMKPIVIAITANSELVIQGLRTFELCIDNIPQEFIDPVLVPYFPELSYALWSHLKPVPYNQAHAHAAVRIFGKLSGRSKKMFNNAPILKSFTKPSECLYLKIPYGNEAKRIFVDSYSSFCKLFILDANQSQDDKKLIFNFCNEAIGWILSQETDAISNCNDVLKDLTFCLIASTRIEDFDEKAIDTLKTICVFYSKQRYSEYQAASTESCSFIVECILEGFSYPISDKIHQTTALIFRFIYETMLTYFNDNNDLLGESNILYPFTTKFTSLCFSKEFDKKIAGFSGISLFFKSIHLGYKWLWSNELRIVRGLLYILKDTQNNVFAYNLLEQCKSTLKQFILTANPAPEDLSEEMKKDRIYSFNQLVSLFISELPNSDKAVREIVQNCLLLLSEVTKISLNELLMPVKDRFLAPILNKPLRALPFNIQIGHVDAITFCLNIRPGILSFGDDLLRLLHEALALADADDASLAGKSTHTKNAPQILTLRIVCVKLLSAALYFPEMQHAELEGLRGRILALFFKCLYTKSQEIVTVAMSGLELVTNSQQKLSKDLLQNGLRPILSNLSEAKKLTIQGLDGLSRLLQLLTGYFKAEIGKKLLDHLHQLLEPAVLEEASNNCLSNSNEINIFIGIIDVFHLLPNTANIFMDDLVSVVLSMENQLRRTESSPFRVPLAKYLCKYPSETIDYFVPRISASLPMLLLFSHILSIKENEILRNEFIRNQDKLMGILFNNQLESIVAFVKVIHSIIVASDENMLNEWIVGNRRMVECLFTLFKSTFFVSRAEEEDFGHPLIVSYIPLFLSVTRTFLRGNLDEIPYIFELLQIFLLKNSPDLSSTLHFFMNDVIKKFSTHQKKSAMNIFLGGINAAPDDLKIIVFKNFVIPLVSDSFAHKSTEAIEDILDYGSINELVWSSYNVDSCPYDDRLKIELLNFTSLLIENASENIAEFKRMIVRVLWSNISSDDVIVKQATFTALAKFISKYDTPFRVVMQGFVSLVRGAFLPDGKSLPIKNSFDSFVPALLKRLSSPSDTSVWMAYCRKVLLEEPCHSLTPAIFLWQIMIKHTEFFDDFAFSFIPFIVNSLSKIGFAANVTNEQKLLTLDLCEIVINWIDRNEKISVIDSENSSNNNDIEKLKGKSHIFIELCANYLFKFLIANSNESGDILDKKFKLLNKSYSLFSYCLLHFHDIQIKLSFLNEKIQILDSSAVDESLIGCLAKILQIILLFSNEQLLQFDLMRLLEKILMINSQRIEQLSTLLIQKLLQPLSVQNQFTDFQFNLVKFLKNFIMNSIISLSNINNILSILEIQDNLIVSELTESFSNQLEELFGVLLQKYSTQLASPENASEQLPASACMKIINLLNGISSFSQEHKINYFNNLLLLIAIAKEEALLVFLLEMFSKWILNDSDVDYSNSIESTPISSSHNSPTKFTQSPRNTNFTVKQCLILYAKLFKNIQFNHGTIKKTHFGIFYNSLFDIFDSPPVKNLFVHDDEAKEDFEFLFVAGIQCDDLQVREKFLQFLFEKLILSCSNENSSNLSFAIEYLFETVRWESFAGGFWLGPVMEILVKFIYSMNVVLNNPLKDSSLLKATLQLANCSSTFGHELWLQFFPIIWNLLPSSQYSSVSRAFIIALSREHSSFQSGNTQNAVVNALLCSFIACTPVVPLPAHLVTYLAKTFSLWHVGICYLEAVHENGKNNYVPFQGILTLHEDEEHDEGKIIEQVLQTTNDALSVLYSLLAESDWYLGLERRSCAFSDTLNAISLRQMHLWPQAQASYETVQIKARTGVIPFSESEFTHWEREWMECAKRLQQWDTVGEIAKIEPNPLAAIESLWKSSDFIENTKSQEWLMNIVKAQPSVPIGREPIWFNSYKKIYESFLNIHLVTAGHPEKHVEFQQSLEVAVQNALRAWDILPYGKAREHLVHLFQLMVELNESQTIFLNLSPATISSRPQAIAEIKAVLSSWRDRLPNQCDDLNVWSELIAWRQHVFDVISNQMQIIISDQSLPTSAAAQQPHALQALGAFSYRGFHESAWLINKFAHIARKQGLSNVCLTSLNKIYTLPNIEVQDAFKKLREQIKCHLSSSSSLEMQTCLEVINSSNLGYFTPQQKSEFFSFKAQVVSRLDHPEEASKIFGEAIEIDSTCSKVWAAWAEFNDERFMQSKEMQFAASAFSHYLKAATLTKSGKGIRKLLSRVLWLFSFEDATGTLGKVFDSFMIEFPVWHWVPFIPQLLSSLSKRESTQARYVLSLIAKKYPQALYFPLRTANEEFKTLSIQKAPPVATSVITVNPQDASLPSVSSELSSPITSSSTTPSDTIQSSMPSRKLPHEMTEELMALLKTAHPLLALSMENMVEHIIQRLRATPDEDLYRILTTLLYEGFQQIYLRNCSTSTSPSSSSTTSDSHSMMESSLCRVSEILASPSHFASSNNLKYKEAFDQDFIRTKPSLHQIISRLVEWRSKLLPVLTALPSVIQLENFSRYLVEFDHQKYEDVELPGQYLSLERDSPVDFVKIDRFEPISTIVRRHGASFRRITIRCSDGNLYSFLVQNPAARHSRREEKILQLFRFLNSVIERKKETNRRNLQFTIPNIIPLSVHVRMFSDYEGTVSLEDILEEYLVDKPVESIVIQAWEMLNVKMQSIEKCSSSISNSETISDPVGSSSNSKKSSSDSLNAKTDVFEEISKTVVPSTLLKSYAQSSFATHSEFWLFRQHFISQYATVSFITYALSLTHRFPHKILFNRFNGKVSMSDVLPSGNHIGLYTLNEAVPFRLTPNVQTLIGSIGLEGVFCASLQALALVLCNVHGFEVENYFALAIRDEIFASSSSSSNDVELIGKTVHNVEIVFKRIQTLACVRDIERFSEVSGPINQAVIDLVSAANNPQKLCLMEPHWHPWL